MTVEGIDLSQWQTSTPRLDLVRFAGVRATYGTRPDTMYVHHVRSIHTAARYAIAYHFGTGATPGRTQAAAFLAATGLAPPDRLYALDLETERGKPPMPLAEARAFIAAVRATGRACLLYHSESNFPRLGQSGDWVANWSHAPSRPWLFWQYRGSPLDLDRFHGSAAELDKLTGHGAPVLWRVIFPAGTYRTARVAGGRFLGYGAPFTTGGMSAWAGPAVTLRNGSHTTTWFRLLTGARAGTWVYRFDRRLHWRR